MKSKYNKLTCLFGHHDYSEEITMDKHGNRVYLCKICKRSGYFKWIRGYEVWFDYDEDGNLTHKKYSDRFETWYDYDREGNCTHERWSNGQEWQYKFEVKRRFKKRKKGILL